MVDERVGPLAGLRVVELGALGPGPFGCMLLSDMGADVIRVERTEKDVDSYPDVVLRGRRSIRLDLKSNEGAATLIRLIETSDVLCEGFRPGVLERLGFPPETCWRHNERLVIARVTGWGQDGPLSQTVGHDVNYAARSGLLHAVGAKGGGPVIPLNIAADGAGGMMMAFGIVCGVLEARQSGQGQVIDVAMVDASALLMAKWYGELAAGRWLDQRGSNRVDGGSHYYHIYRTSDNHYLSVGAIEPKFYERFMAIIGIDPATVPAQDDRRYWDLQISRVAAIIESQSLEYWLDLFDNEEVCVAPVLSLNDAPNDPHLKSRGTYVDVDGIVQPGEVPRFGRTPGAPGRIPAIGEHTQEIIEELGFRKG
jgi:alpha-methylacyl-CoA racemase